MLPRVKPPAFRLSILDRMSASCQGIRGPPVSTWFTPSCLTRRMPLSSNRPAAREPPPISRHSSGIPDPSELLLCARPPEIAVAEMAAALTACIIFLRDKSECKMNPPLARYQSRGVAVGWLVVFRIFGSGGDLLFQAGHAGMRLLNFAPLSLDQGSAFAGNIGVHYTLKSSLGGILAIFAYGGDCAGIPAGHDRFQIDPTAIHRARQCAGIHRTASEPLHFRLERPRKLRALFCIAFENRPQLCIMNVSGHRVIAVFPVLTNLNKSI